MTDISHLPSKRFVKKYRPSDGAPYSEIDYTLLITNDKSGLMKFAVEINGKQYGVVNANY